MRTRIKPWQWLVLALVAALVLFNVYARYFGPGASDAKLSSPMMPSYSEESWASEEEALQHCRNPVPVARPLTPEEPQEETWRCPR